MDQKRKLVIIYFVIWCFHLTASYTVVRYIILDKNGQLGHVYRSKKELLGLSSQFIVVTWVTKHHFVGGFEKKVNVGLVDLL